MLARKNAFPLGISLLEILISIGIVAIGLVGVAALVPLAHSKAEKGLQRDRSSAYGQRAYREFKVRGFDRPRSEFGAWVTTDGSPIVPTAYCFDPLFVATRQSTPGLTNQEQPNVAPDRFPDAWAAGKPDNFSRNAPLFSIPRLTIFTPTDPPVPINRWQAEAVFMLQDDLDIKVDEDDENEKRKQQFTWTTNASLGKRNRDSAYSWFATIVPTSRLNTEFPNFQPSYANERYLLSVVVLKRREIFHRDNTATGRPTRDTALPNQEIIARVLPPTTMGGPANSLSSPTGSSTRELHLAPFDASNSDLGATFYDLKPGSWIAIGQQLSFPSQGPNKVNTLRWAKVVSQPETPEADATLGATVVVTVEAPDFSFRRLDPTKPTPPNVSAASGGLIPTYAIYVRNVMNVYEKTIRLDSMP